MERGSGEAVRLRAYYLWEAEGRPDGQVVEHWITASKEVPPRADPIDPLLRRQKASSLC